MRVVWKEKPVIVLDHAGSESQQEDMVKNRVIDIFPSETLIQVIGIVWLFTEKLQQRTKCGEYYYIPVSQEGNQMSLYTYIDTWNQTWLAWFSGWRRHLFCRTPRFE